MLRRLGVVPANAPVYVASSALAELEVGCCFRAAGRPESQAELHEVIRANGIQVIQFTNHTAAEYGTLKAALMRQYNREGVKNAAKWPELWTSPDPGATLGVDELDLFAIAHAMERRLVLATSDPLQRICDGLRLQGVSPPDLDDWCT